MNFIGTKRMSKGIFLYGAYTFSKVLTNVNDVLNVFNRHYSGGVDLNMNSAPFGNIRTASGFRTGQLGARIEW